MEMKQMLAIFLYAFKLAHKAAQATLNINNAFGQGTINERTVQCWFEKFRHGDKSFEDKEGRGRPSAVYINELKALVEADPRTTVREIAEELGVSHLTVLEHLKQLGKSKKLYNWVPLKLNENQKIIVSNCRLRFFLRNKSDSFLDRIVSCDDKWIAYDNRRRSALWLDQGEAP